MYYVKNMFDMHVNHSEEEIEAFGKEEYEYLETRVKPRDDSLSSLDWRCITTQDKKDKVIDEIVRNPFYYLNNVKLPIMGGGEMNFRFHVGHIFSTILHEFGVNWFLESPRTTLRTNYLILMAIWEAVKEWKNNGILNDLQGSKESKNHILFLCRSHDHAMGLKKRARDILNANPILRSIVSADQFIFVTELNERDDFTNTYNKYLKVFIPDFEFSVNQEKLSILFNSECNIYAESVFRSHESSEEDGRFLKTLSTWIDRGIPTIEDSPIKFQDTLPTIMREYAKNTLVRVLVNSNQLQMNNEYFKSLLYDEQDYLAEMCIERPLKYMI